MNKSKVVVLGNGYIGSAFGDAGYDVIGADQLRVTSGMFFEDALERTLAPYNTVINCIGKTDTRWSEHAENFKELMLVNAEFVSYLSDYCATHNTKLVHISTGDLYGNNHDVDENKESKRDLDVGTNYRLSKLVGERYCNEKDLILRIRLPFDGRDHPKNLLKKALTYTKFFVYTNDYTYVPDLINATEALLEANKSGIYNVAGWENSSIIELLKEVLKLPQFESYDAHDETNPNMIHELSNVHVHNFMNIDKLMDIYRPIHLHTALMVSYAELIKKTV